ncbi:MAG: cyclic nucleotide-binding domain-containing protein, partial [Magnetococcales bacterium]|nr:cyclic nucleotide-binding domain-containing protein [Magnetococcales bacterium]
MESDITLEDLIAFLARIPGFNDLSRQEMEELIAPIISVAHFEPGQIIIKRGSVGRTVFFLYDGRVRVDIPADGGGEERHFFLEEG